MKDGIVVPEIITLKTYGGSMKTMLVVLFVCLLSVSAFAQDQKNSQVTSNVINLGLKDVPFESVAYQIIVNHCGFDLKMEQGLKPKRISVVGEYTCVQVLDVIARAADLYIITVDEKANKYRIVSRNTYLAYEKDQAKKPEQDRLAAEKALKDFEAQQAELDEKAAQEAMIAKAVTAPTGRTDNLGFETQSANAPKNVSATIGCVNVTDSSNLSKTGNITRQTSTNRGCNHSFGQTLQGGIGDLFRQRGYTILVAQTGNQSQVRTVASREFTPGTRTGLTHRVNPGATPTFETPGYVVTTELSLITTATEKNGFDPKEFCSDSKNNVTRVVKGKSTAAKIVRETARTVNSYCDDVNHKSVTKMTEGVVIVRYVDPAGRMFGPYRAAAKLTWEESEKGQVLVNTNDKSNSPTVTAFEKALLNALDQQIPTRIQ